MHDVYYLKRVSCRPYATWRFGFYWRERKFKPFRRHSFAFCYFRNEQIITGFLPQVLISTISGISPRCDGNKRKRCIEWLKTCHPWGRSIAGVTKVLTKITFLRRPCISQLSMWKQSKGTWRTQARGPLSVLKPITVEQLPKEGGSSDKDRRQCSH